MICKQRVEVGIYHASSRFFFVVDTEENDLEKIYEYNDFLHRHSQLGILQRVKTLDPQKIMFKIYGYNFYFEVNGLSKGDTKIQSLSNLHFHETIHEQGIVLNSKIINLMFHKNFRIKILNL